MSYRYHARTYFNSHVTLVTGSNLPGFTAAFCGALVGQLNRTDDDGLVFINAHTGESIDLGPLGWPAAGGEILDFLKSNGVI